VSLSIAASESDPKKLYASLGKSVGSTEESFPPVPL
jgi:hypothetical protein